MLAGALAGLLAAETAIRLKLVLPVRQVIRGRPMEVINGVPIWTDPGQDSAARENRACVEQHPQRRRVLFFGTSITFGANVRADAVFPHLLEQELNRRRPVPGFCVLNFAVPAFTQDQRSAVAGREIPKYRPDLVLDQDWRLDQGHAGYRILGDAIYSLGGLQLRPDGFPGLRFVPDHLNRELFLHSRLYEWITLSWGQPSPPEPFVPDTDHEAELTAFAALVRESGARPAFYVVPDMGYPMSETSRVDRQWDEGQLALGRKHGFDVTVLRPLLRDQDNRQLGRDFWHFSEKGHQVVAERMLPWILQLLDASAPR